MLEKNDLEQIEKIVNGLGKNLHKEINGAEVRLNKKMDDNEKNLRDSISGVEVRLNKKIDETENRIISVISREVTDLAEINCAVIEKIDKIFELEKRIMRIEHKVGIVG